MEQLAQFVTKSFEYNNNRVLDLLNMATRVDDDDSNHQLKNYAKKQETQFINEQLNSDSDGDESEEIDITDESLPRHSPKPTVHDSSGDKQELNRQAQSSPLSLVKKATKGAPKNWLISDDDNTATTPRRPTDENQRPQKGFFDALNLSRVAEYSSAHTVDVVQFRAKPVTELLKEIRKFQSATPPPLSTRLDDNYESRSSSPGENNQEGKCI